MGTGHIARSGQLSLAAPNLLGRQFDVTAPNTHRVTDITYIRTHEGWAYLAVVVLDLHWSQVVGWMMQVQMQAELVLKVLLSVAGSISGVPQLTCRARTPANGARRAKSATRDRRPSRKSVVASTAQGRFRSNHRLGV
ncbi:DDE-type integrase/transposase/recombinase [Dokdonella sp. MW10]|uniref:DDE-type integrase/transposase/recombinase n=1 Tax=Dokdonella sp. MW10 TaxID=2992926 RepID=UPI003F8044E7